MFVTEENKAKLKHKLLSRHVISKNGCWLWTGAKIPGGYGSIGIKGHNQLGVHRISYELWKGSLSKGICVLHTCDVRNCFNPEHLFLGTKGDNNKDRAQKGRTNRAYGEAANSAKLKTEQVLEIRWSRETHAALAKRFGVGRTQISRIKARKRWAHLP